MKNEKRGFGRLAAGGFTSVELAIVIAIIMIIAVVLISVIVPERQPMMTNEGVVVHALREMPDPKEEGLERKGLLGEFLADWLEGSSTIHVMQGYLFGAHIEHDYLSGKMIVVYAWPQESGKTGNLCFARFPNGRTYYSDNAKYSGIEDPPKPVIHTDGSVSFYRGIWKPYN